MQGGSSNGLYAYALRQITPEMLYADNEASQNAGIIYTGNGVYTKDNKNTDNNANYNANIKDSENIKDNDYPDNRNGQDIRIITIQTV